MAIGRKISLTPNVKSKKINVTATAGQTLFTVTGGYRVNNIGVYRNGVLLAVGSDGLQMVYEEYGRGVAEDDKRDSVSALLPCFLADGERVCCSARGRVTQSASGNASSLLLQPPRRTTSFGPTPPRLQLSDATRPLGSHFVTGLDHKPRRVQGASCD